MQGDILTRSVPLHKDQKVLVRDGGGGREAGLQGGGGGMVSSSAGAVLTVGIRDGL